MAEPHSEKRTHLVIAMPLLAAPAVPDVARIVAELRDATGPHYAVTDVRTSDQIATFVLDEDLVTITDMGAPVPWSDLEGPSTKNGAGRRPSKSAGLREAIVVTLSTKDPDPFRASLRLTHVFAADLAASGALGVYWGEGAVVNSADVFTEMTHHADREYLTPRVVTAPPRAASRARGSARRRSPGRAPRRCAVRRG